MRKYTYIPGSVVALFTAMLLLFPTGQAEAAIDGVTGTKFRIVAKTDYVSTADGGSMQFWGYSLGASRPQYPGPTLIVNEGEEITITHINRLKVAGGGPAPNTSIVFPGMQVKATCAKPGIDTCADGDLTMEAERDGDQVRYIFTPDKPGTYMYYSGTNVGLQVEMGLIGTIIVRPTGYNPSAPTAYGHADTAFDREYLFFLSEMDPRIHLEVEQNGPDSPTLKGYLDNYFSNYWFINGRTAPDDLAGSNVFWLPTQPYNSNPRMHPGEHVLMRVVGAGREMHPFHHHGNHAKVIARDGVLLESTPGAGPDIGREGFTITSEPGKTVDAIFTWTGEGLNWDIYGGTDVADTHDHACGMSANVAAGWDGVTIYDPVTGEYCPDHGKPFPVVLPGLQELAFGGWWGGSPYLGTLGTLPPGEGGLNPNGGFSFMWHSHTEKELTNWDIFPGGMLTMMIIEPPGVPIIE